MAVVNVASSFFKGPQISTRSSSHATANMAIARLLQCYALSLALASLAMAHGGEHQKPIEVAADADWATRHMAGTGKTLNSPFKPMLF